MKLSHFAVALLVCPALVLAKAPEGVLPSAPPLQSSNESADSRPADPSLPRPKLGAPPNWVNVAPLPKPPTDSAGARPRAPRA